MVQGRFKSLPEHGASSSAQLCHAAASLLFEHTTVWMALSKQGLSLASSEHSRHKQVVVMARLVSQLPTDRQSMAGNTATITLLKSCTGLGDDQKVLTAPRQARPASVAENCKSAAPPQHWQSLGYRSHSEMNWRAGSPRRKHSAGEILPQEQPVCSDQMIDRSVSVV